MISTNVSVEEPFGECLLGHRPPQTSPATLSDNIGVFTNTGADAAFRGPDVQFAALTRRTV